MHVTWSGKQMGSHFARLPVMGRDKRIQMGGHGARNDLKAFVGKSILSVKGRGRFHIKARIGEALLRGEGSLGPLSIFG